MRYLTALLLCLSACAEFPELDATATPGVGSAAYPRLLPMEALLDGPPPRAMPEVQAGVEGRAEALRARAARLRAPVMDAATRRRIRDGVRVSG